MAVLVTGGTGFIGSHTCISLHESGIKPIILDNLSNSSIEVLDRLKQITNVDFDFIEGDIGDISLVTRILKEYDIDAVFHFAAYKAVGESTEKPLEYYQNNVTGTLNLLSAMKEVGVKKIVFSSSATVYGEPQYLPIDEGHPISATNPYGNSKVIVESILKDVCAADDKFLAISLRYFNPAGAHHSGLIGENPNGIPNNLMPFISQTATGKREQLNIFGNDYDTHDGTGVRDYIHVLDLAEGHIAAFETHKHNSGFLPYNLGTGKGFSVIDLVNAFTSASNTEIKYVFAPRRKGDVASSYAASSKANNELGWQTKRSIDDIAEDTWRWECQLNS